VCECGRERPFRLFEVLTRNRQSAVGRLERIPRTQEQPPGMCTIPPRQQLSSPTRLVLQRRNFTHLIINTHTQKRDTQRERNTPFTINFFENHVWKIKIKNSLLPNAKLGKQNIENVFCHIQPTNYARAIAQRLP